MKVGWNKQPKLYGPGRATRLQGLQVRDMLKGSCVLRDGEYNWTRKSLGPGAWQTTSDADFPGQSLDRGETMPSMNQMNHHFVLGNSSGKQIPVSEYSLTTSRQDFDKKPTAKAKFYTENRTVNWPDMAPQYRSDVTLGESEYVDSFLKQRQTVNKPIYPRVNTGKVTLPLDPVRFYHQRGTQFQLGDDHQSHLTEQQRAFGRVTSREDMTHMLSSDARLDVEKNRREENSKSNVFRTGDYNHVYAGDVKTTTTTDFGPRTHDPATLLSSKDSPGKRSTMKGPQVNKAIKLSPIADTPNELMRYGRDVTMPMTRKEAEDGKHYHTSAHFKLGQEAVPKASVYGKDFALNSSRGQAVPRLKPPPNANNLLQTDPQFAGLQAKSVTRDTFMSPPAPLPSLLLQNNQKKISSSNVVMSCDLTRSTEDRQLSLSHHDYASPPADHRPSVPGSTRGVGPSLLHTDTALPYPGQSSHTEAASSFAGTLSCGPFAADRLRSKVDTGRLRAQDTKDTHFRMGFSGADFSTSNSLAFNGERNTLADIRPAGKTETRADVHFEHLGHSGNTQDLTAADPYVTSIMEPLRMRLLHRLPALEKAFQASVTQSDFNPRQRLTVDQQKMNEKYERLMNKPLAPSHLFPSDKSTRDHYVSITKGDFAEPDTKM